MSIRINEHQHRVNSILTKKISVSVYTEHRIKFTEICPTQSSPKKNYTDDYLLCIIIIDGPGLQKSGFGSSL